MHIPDSPISQSLHQANAVFNGQQLIVSTGQITRIWQWTGKGLLTRSITRLDTGYTWKNDSVTHHADWQLPVLLTENPDATRNDVNMMVSDDQGFTSEHLLVTVLMKYPSQCLKARFCVRAYPGVPGLHVQLSFCTMDGFEWDTSLHRCENTERANTMALLDRGYRRADFLPIVFGDAHRRAWGFYNNLQYRV